MPVMTQYPARINAAMPSYIRNTIIGGVNNSTIMARIKRTGPPGSQLDLACFSALPQLMILSMKLNGKIQTIKIRASIGRASLISQSIDSSPLDSFENSTNTLRSGGTPQAFTWRVGSSKDAVGSATT